VYGQPGWEAGALRLLGEVASRRRPAEVAVADGDYRAALMAAESLGMHPLAARCHLGLAELHHSADGEEHLARATTMLSELGMPGWRRRRRH
jgi:hypothetical protein